MPEIRYVRIWCKECGDYKLHYVKNDQYICKVCDSVHTNTPLSQIPKEKILEQRNRYRDMKKAEFAKFINMFGTNFSSNRGVESIHETDAGLIAIEEQRQKERDGIIQFKKDEKAKYALVERNSKCLCGSGKKYKKCCMERILSYG